MPLVPVLEEHFAIPFSAGVDKQDPPQPIMTWSHKKRGYRDYFSNGNVESGTSPHNASSSSSSTSSVHLDSGDADRYLLGLTSVDRRAKTVQLETETDFQTVEIFGVGAGGNMKKMETKEDPAASNKRIFLNGVLQSTMHGLEAYHEALVHPALTMVEQASYQQNPKKLRVAIIGGGEGATLREVLKHKSVDYCAMIEIDQEFVELAQEHLKEWNDCQDLAMEKENAEEEDDDDDEEDDDEEEDDSGYRSCFDDPRAEIFTEDAVSWFVGRYGDHATTKAEKFDVIIMDAL